MKLKITERATTMTISARTLVENVLLLIFHFSLRQHYLDQVQRVDDVSFILSARFIPSSPLTYDTRFLAFLPYKT